MPRYAYKCQNGHVYEEERSMHAEQKLINCSECGEKLNRDYSDLASTMRFRIRARGEKYE